MKRTKALEAKRRGWRWRSMDGEFWTIDTMESDHMLNVTKMLYNELAERQGLRIVNRTINGLTSGLRTNRERLETVLMLLDELQHRTDLPRKMEDDLKRIEIEIGSLAKSMNRSKSPQVDFQHEDAMEFFRQLRKRA
jgi:hypothetical protein